jgi:hypothetical protein
MDQTGPKRKREGSVDSVSKEDIKRAKEELESDVPELAPEKYDAEPSGSGDGEGIGHGDAKGRAVDGGGPTPKDDGTPQKAK